MQQETEKSAYKNTFISLQTWQTWINFQCSTIWWQLADVHRVCITYDLLRYKSFRMLILRRYGLLKYLALKCWLQHSQKNGKVMILSYLQNNWIHFILFRPNLPYFFRMANHIFCILIEIKYYSELNLYIFMIELFTYLFFFRGVYSYFSDFFFCF